MAQECMAPKVSKEQRKIKSISERQFHYIFNNKIDFDCQYPSKTKQSLKDCYIKNIRRDIINFLKWKDQKEETKTMLDSPDLLMLEEALGPSDALSSTSSKNSDEEQISTSLNFSIGNVASFDDISEAVSEFYLEWKKKKAVKSKVLK